METTDNTPATHLKRVALITGVGPGLGAALARRFASEGFRVAMVARTPQFIDELAHGLAADGKPALALVGDVSRPKEVATFVAKVRAGFGPIGVFVHNASSSSGDGLLKTTPEQFEQAWRVTTFGGFVCAREIAPDMVASGAGAMLFTGATSSVRGGGWLAFSSAKFATRGLVQSLARELWPKGVHVAHVVVDGIIGPPRRPNEQINDAEEPLLDPDAMASAYFNLAMQERSAWTLELDLRPNREQFFI